MFFSNAFAAWLCEQFETPSAHSAFACGNGMALSLYILPSTYCHRPTSAVKSAPALGSGLKTPCALGIAASIAACATDSFAPPGLARVTPNDGCAPAPTPYTFGP